VAHVHADAKLPRDRVVLFLDADAHVHHTRNGPQPRLGAPVEQLANGRILRAQLFVVHRRPSAPRVMFIA
jgi:hypothetical protein